MAFGFQGNEWIIILIAILLIFGPKKLPELARGIGKALYEFKRASQGLLEEEEEEKSKASVKASAGKASEEGGEKTAEAKAEAKKIKSEAQQEAASIVEQLKQSAEQEAGQLGTEMSAAARQHNQKRMLIAKREELDTSWQSVQSMVGSAALKGRVSVLKTLMALAKEQNSGKGVLRPVAIDRKVLEDLGRKFTMGDDIDGLGGFVIESDGGTVSMDYRFESRLEVAWDDNLAAIAETLFS